jgi:hypothetical protein
MKIALCAIAFFVYSSFCIANGNIVIGFGQPYGGLLGIKLGHSDDQGRYYASLGSYGPIGVGYGAGYDIVVFDDHHSLGIFYGVIGGSESEGQYIGPMINYQFYRTGFNEPSWLFGLSAGYGKTDKEPDQDSRAILFNIGYQF